MNIESKIKSRMEVRSFAKESDEVRIDFGTTSFDENGKIFSVDQGFIYDNSGMQCGDFRTFGDFIGEFDNRRIMINVMFKHLDKVKDIIDMFTSINNNEYDDVEEFKHERRFREAKEAKESTVPVDTPTVDVPVTDPTADVAPPVEETPVEETPVEETPVEETPVEETPVETKTNTTKKSTKKTTTTETSTEETTTTA